MYVVVSVDGSQRNRQATDFNTTLWIAIYIYLWRPLKASMLLVMPKPSAATLRAVTGNTLQVNTAHIN